MRQKVSEQDEYGSSAQETTAALPPLPEKRKKGQQREMLHTANKWCT